jgi:transcriptional regulator with XRE-family HTH domain
MTFEEYLISWNGGKIRGAQTRLAKKLKIAQSAISRWVNGDGIPEEDLRIPVAKELGISVEQLLSSLPPKNNNSFMRVCEDVFKHKYDSILFKGILSEEELSDLKKICEKDVRSNWDEIRWLIKSYANGHLMPVKGGIK